MQTLSKDQQHAINEKAIKILTTAGDTVQGFVNAIGAERTSDLFTKDKSPFIILYKAKTKGGDNMVLAINKSYVVWAEFETEDDS